jgi:hypothetical protein
MNKGCVFESRQDNNSSRLTNGCAVVDAEGDSLIKSVINLKKRVNADIVEATQMLKLPFSCQIFGSGIQFYI